MKFKLTLVVAIVATKIARALNRLEGAAYTKAYAAQAIATRTGRMKLQAELRTAELAASAARQVLENKTEAYRRLATGYPEALAAVNDKVYGA
jgi:hypothetical protein